MKIKYVKIDGIHCEHCIETITNELLKSKKIKKVIIKNNIAHITYEGNLTNKEIIKTINGLDYITKDEYILDSLNRLNNRIELKEFILIVSIIIIIWLLIKNIVGFNIFNVIPNIDSSITYGMLFVTGLLTSIHCISMCGAINLVAVSSSKKGIKSPLLYNLGRVVSYTLIGGIVGLLGSVISFNDTVKGIIILIASILMLLMSLSMLGIIDFRLPKFKRIKSKSHNAFIIGLLNGFMPCGPLQAMQVYALSTGSFIKGALSMFLFSLGTVPLMLFVGVFYSIIKGKGKILLNKIASILIMILSLVMLNRGLITLGFNIENIFNDYGSYTKSTIKENYQEVKFDLEYSDYEDIIVQKGIPVRMIINVDKKYLTGCNNEISIKEFNINKKLEEGENIIEFVPEDEGVYTYTCWMEMITNNIKVIDNKKIFKED